MHQSGMVIEMLECTNLWKSKAKNSDHNQHEIPQIALSRDAFAVFLWRKDCF